MKANVKLADFSGQRIYIGLDVHKNMWKVSIYQEDIFHKTYTQPSSPSILVGYLRRHFPNADYYSAYEAGHSGFWIHRDLESLGVRNIVTHAADVPTSDKEYRHKSDRIDSHKLARSLKNGDLKGIYVPPLVDEQDRALVRLRGRFVVNQTRVKNRIKHLLMQFGLTVPEALAQSAWSKAYVRWLEGLDIGTGNGTQVLRTYLREYQFLRDSIKELEGQLRKLATTERYSSKMDSIRSIPSIGLVSAFVLLSELGEITRFKSFDHLCWYAGLVPGRSQSAEKDKIGRMSNRGNRHLRYILIECAWIAISKDPVMGLCYGKLKKKGKSSNEAIIKIARKLLNRIRYVMKHQCQYQQGVLS